MVVLYYDTPYFSAFDVGSAGALGKFLYTGEDPDNVPVTLKICGEPSSTAMGAVVSHACSVAIMETVLVISRRHT